MTAKPSSHMLVRVFSIVLLLSLMLSSTQMNAPTQVRAQQPEPPIPVEPRSGPTTKIVGGGPATPGEWPWQVAIVYSTGYPEPWYRQFCGGSLVAPQWVVTAAHCVWNFGISAPYPAASQNTIAGIYDLWAGTGYQEKTVSAVYVHPDFDDQTFDFDIALLQLSSAVTLGGAGESATAVIPPVRTTIGDLAGSSSWVTGWGDTESTPQFPDYLYEVQVPIITNALCNDVNHYPGLITSNMMCAGYDAGGYDSCQGDSGGPLVVYTDGAWRLAGVVSWGDGCAEPLKLGVYTRVSNFTDWILGQAGITISGNAGVAGATLGYSGTAFTGSVVADGSGNYTFDVPYGWAGTVTPSLTGYTFTPTDTVYPSLSTDQTGQNYTANLVTITISGNAGVAGATLSYDNGGPETATADGSGDYTFDVPYGWAGTVTPSLSGYAFIPSHTDYPSLSTDQTGQDYTAGNSEIVYTLTVISDHGTVTPDLLPPYHYGDTVHLDVAAATGWTFTNWSGDASGSADPLTVVIDGDKTITANYSQNVYTLTVISDHGTVTPDLLPPYHDGDTVHLDVAASTGWTFTNWSGDASGSDDPLTVVMNGDKTITANYSQNVYTLTVISDHGTVTPDLLPPYHYGDTVHLDVAASTGWTFTNWSGDASGSADPLTVVMDGDKTITANYSQNVYTLTVISDHGTVTPDLLPPYHYGDTVHLDVAASTDWTFTNWSGDASGSDDPLTVVMNGDKTITANYTAIPLPSAVISDYDGDSKTDPVVFEKASGNWFVVGSTDGFFAPALGFGNDTAYIPVPADYDGDGETDAAVFEKATGNWFVVGSMQGFFTPALGFGNDTAYIPVPDDYDGDGQADPAVYEKATGNWFVVGSTDGFFTPALGFGSPSFIPVPADYDGDGEADAAVFEKATGNWFVVGSTQGFFTPALGFGNDTAYIPVPADYDGDGETDAAVFEKASGHWFVVGSTDGFFTPALGFGDDTNYITQPGDYDGDGETDAAVYEKATGNWFVVGSTDGFFTPALGFGGPSFMPVVWQAK